MAALTLGQMLDISLGSSRAGIIDFEQLYNLLNGMLLHLGLKDLLVKENGEPLEGAEESPFAFLKELKQRVEANEKEIAELRALCQQLRLEVDEVKLEQAQMAEDLQYMLQNFDMEEFQNMLDELRNQLYESLMAAMKEMLRGGPASRDKKKGGYHLPESEDDIDLIVIGNEIPLVERTKTPKRGDNQPGSPPGKEENASSEPVSTGENDMGQSDMGQSRGRRGTGRRGTGMGQNELRRNVQLSDTGQNDMGQDNMGQKDMGRNVQWSNRGRSDMGQNDMGQDNMGQKDMGRNMQWSNRGRSDMGQSDMGQDNMGQKDMGRNVQWRNRGQSDMGQSDMGQDDMGQRGMRRNVQWNDAGQSDMEQKDMGWNMGQSDMGQKDMGQDDMGQDGIGQDDMGQIKDEEMEMRISKEEALPSPLDSPPGMTSMGEMKEEEIKMSISKAPPHVQKMSSDGSFTTSEMHPRAPGSHAPVQGVQSVQGHPGSQSLWIPAESVAGTSSRLPTSKEAHGGGRLKMEAYPAEGGLMFLRVPTSEYSPCDPFVPGRRSEVIQSTRPASPGFSMRLPPAHRQEQREQGPEGYFRRSPMYSGGKHTSVCPVQPMEPLLPDPNMPGVVELMGKDGVVYRGRTVIDETD